HRREGGEKRSMVTLYQVRMQLAAPEQQTGVDLLGEKKGTRAVAPLLHFARDVKSSVAIRPYEVDERGHGVAACGHARQHAIDVIEYLNSSLAAQRLAQGEQACIAGSYKDVLHDVLSRLSCPACIKRRAYLLTRKRKAMRITSVGDACWAAARVTRKEIGRASCREGVG